MSRERDHRAKWLRFRALGGLEPEVSEVETSQMGIKHMSHLVYESGQDVKKFLHLLKQDAATYDVDPADVYDSDLDPDGKWTYQLDFDEVRSLRRLSCAAYEYGRRNPNEITVDNYQETLHRLDELCTLLKTAEEIEVAPVLSQG